ncbi:GNAT family N-acetyltransferase [Asticcacaulis sp. AC402]|uniref:GNAT family N-acetyltransferase n=1 Tax=Asticcacaulis sp. AC402 TaxID=1282361 RepID=UPI0003C3B2A2|nr:GNAT family N-acetyltransferase [Asticcacaulis sp. AC402]ESQ76615.1 hypothetical protein ABAC402_02775 [Asticcacaulis sp. AC402]
MLVRHWQPDDGPVAAELIRAILNDEFDFPVTRADVDDVEFNAYGEGLWVGDDHGRIVGTVALLVYGDRQGALRRMFVVADRRGSAFGVGQALMDRLVAEARLRNLEDIILGTVAKFDRALGFYAKNGYVQIPHHAVPCGFPVMPPDDIFYRLDLSA